MVAWVIGLAVPKSVYSLVIAKSQVLPITPVLRGLGSKVFPLKSVSISETK